MQESDFEGQKVCGSPNLAPKLMSGDHTCPEHCTSKLSLHLNKNNVEINPKTGEFSMKNPSDALKVSKTISNKLVIFWQIQVKQNKTVFRQCKPDDISFIKNDSQFGDNL